LSVNTGSLTLPSGFSLVSSPATTVSPNMSTSFSVRLDAYMTGVFSGDVSFTNSDADESPFSFHINGTVAAPAPEMDLRLDGTSLVDGQSSVLFGNTAFGSAVSKTFTIYNLGQGTLSLNSGVTVPSGFSVLMPPS